MVGGGVARPPRGARSERVGFGLPDRIGKYSLDLDRARRRPRPPAGLRPRTRADQHPLCEDPEQGWAAIERHVVHVITEYAKWAEQEGGRLQLAVQGL